MNATQIKYARGRAERILARRTLEIRDRYTVAESRLSDAETFRALEAGEFTVRRNPKRNSCHYLRDYIKFVNETDASTDRAAITKEENKLKKRFDDLIDGLVLGDAEDALKMLHDFETE